MPTYNFRNKETGEVTEEFMKIAEYDDFLESHPELERYYASSDSLDIISGHAQKPDDNFRDILRRIKHKHAHTNVNTF